MKEKIKGKKKERSRNEKRMWKRVEEQPDKM